MSVTTPGESKKLVEYLLGDLRQLSTEAKKKHNHVKEAAEAGVVRVRNISSASSENPLLTNLRAASNELLHPLLLACATRQTKLVQIALQGIQRLVQFRILEPSCANVVVSELWNLVEAECEELKVLQTVPQLVSAHLLITSHNLAKCIVMCFRLHFAKDPVVINAASAAVRQVISGVFERVIQEDGVFSNELTVVPSAGGKPSPRSAPPTLRPCAADAYLLFRDLCLVINAEPAIWLVGMREITRTLGLELLETILKNYPSVFYKHSELATMVKQEVCQLVIKLFSPSLKPASSRSSLAGLPSEKPYFPIAMRLVRVVVVLLTNYHQILPTECEIFVSHLMKFVEMDKNPWQKALALEALHKIVAQSSLLRWMGEHFDSKENSSQLVGSVAECLTNAIKTSFSHPLPRNENEPDGETLVQNGVPGFFHKGVWQPYIELLTSKKTPFMDSLEKHDAGEVPEAYVVSRCCSAVTDLCQSLYSSIDQLLQEDPSGKENGSFTDRSHVAQALFTSTFRGIFPSIGILLNTSTDETVVDQLLCSLSMIVSMGFRLRAVKETQGALYLMSAASTPNGEYLAIFGSLKPPESCENILTDCSLPSQKVVAVGSPCPSPFVPPELWNQQIVMTARNLQAAKILLGVMSSHVEAVDEQWYFCLSICQHLSWLMAMKPYSNGVFSKDKAEADSVLSPVSANPATVTTAAMSETPMLADFFDKIFATSSQLSKESLALFLDALLRLSDEQAAVCATGRECSLFPLAGILRVSVVNLHRIMEWWSKTSTHFLKICGHSSTALRDWAALSLTSLVKNAVKTKTDLSDEELQKLCYSSLHAMSDTTADEVRKRQLECLMSSMQRDGASLHNSSWHIFIDIVASVVAQDSCCDESLVRQGYLGIRLMSADFLQSLPFGCIPALVEAIARYGSQQADQNISLSALALLWTISDFIYRKAEVVEVAEVEKVWLVLYTCLSELCVDSRHSVRKSACQTLLQIVVAHGHALRPHTWNHMIWQILIPLLEKVRSQTRSASTEKTTKGIIMHHSRDTEKKQWTETCINTLSACCKMYIAQRKVLLKLDDFGAAWEALLSYLEWGACYENAELSLCASKSFQEVLLGRISAQTLDINMRDRASSSPDAHVTEQIPSLPVAQWVESWNTWNRIARGMAKHTSAVVTGQGVPKGVYIPGPSHLTTLLHIFPPLFTRAAKHIKVNELKGDELPSVMESLASIPVPGEQAPFVLPSPTSHITPTQEAILDCCKTIVTECVNSSDALKTAIPDQIRLLLRFASFAIKPMNRLCPPGKKYNDWAQQFIIPFSELSLRMAIDCFVSTASLPEVVKSQVMVDVVKFLGDPLYIRYQCISSSTWKLAAASLMTVLRVIIPLARQQGDVYVNLWPAICDTLEKFLFSPNTCHTLPADERKRDELSECQAVELVRSEILPYSGSLPPASVQRLIALLNRGSISQLDPNDVLASDSHMQRAELARACFDALLSTSSSEVGGIGHVAVTSLLERCTRVLVDFVRDSAGAGDLSLPRTRLAEMCAALQAIEALISRLSRDPSLNELYQQLVSLYPTVVDLAPCCGGDPQLSSQIVSSLKSYQTLMLLKLVPRL